MKVSVFYNLDKDSDFCNPKVHKEVLQKTPPALKGAIRQELSELQQICKNRFSPTQSAQEKAKILTGLNEIQFDDAIKNLVKLAITNKRITADALENARNTIAGEKDKGAELLKNLPRMTMEDIREITAALLGDTETMRELYVTLPQVILEIRDPISGKIQEMNGSEFWKKLGLPDVSSF